MVTLSDWTNHRIFGGSEPIDADRFIFHYTSVGNAAGIALTKQLMLSPLTLLNDPQEATMRSVMTVTTSGSSGERPKKVTEWERVGFEIILSQHRESVRVGCFTRDAGLGSSGTARRSNNRGYARQRTWTQYGESHSGICLVLDRVQLENVMKETLGTKARSSPVEYVEGFSKALSSAETVDFDNPDPRTHFEEAIVPSLFFKNSDWCNEREHRIVVWDWSHPSCSLALSQGVVGIVLGLKFEARMMPVALDIAKAFQVEDSTAILMLNNAVLDPVPVAGRDGQWHRWTDQDYRMADSPIFDPE